VPTGGDTVGWRRNEKGGPENLGRSEAGQALEQGQRGRLYSCRARASFAFYRHLGSFQPAGTSERFQPSGRSDPRQVNTGIPFWRHNSTRVRSFSCSVAKYAVG